MDFKNIGKNVTNTMTVLIITISDQTVYKYNLAQVKILFYFLQNTRVTFKSNTLLVILNVLLVFSTRWILIKTAFVE